MAHTEMDPSCRYDYDRPDSPLSRAPAARETVMTPSRPRRRDVLAALGGGTVATLAGCNGLGVDGDPHYEDGEVGDVDADDRSAEEMAAAAALAEQEIHEGVTPLGNLELADHEFVVEDDFRGPTVQGLVENAGDDRIELVEVRVRVYDDAGTQLGRYLDRTGDLAAGTTWAFQVVLLESPVDIADYDLTVLGTPT